MGKRGSEREFLHLLPLQKIELLWHTSLEKKKPVQSLKHDQGILTQTITIANRQ